MASRRAVFLAVFFLVLLFVFPAIAFAATTGGHTESMHRRLGEKSKSVKMETRSYIPKRHRKLGEKTKPSQDAEFNVVSYGAVGDGQTDDTQAFEKTWTKVCSSSTPATMLVPKEKTFLVKQTTFSGQCKSSVRFKLDGTLVAPDRSTWPKENIRKWIVFSNVDKLTVTGDGTMDGKGELWWKNSCRVHKNLKCTEAPTVLLRSKCNHLKVEDIKLLNSQQMHMSVEDCKDVILKNVKIVAPGDSPNTDGIHIARTKDIQVLDCNIKTGDDCMSIETGTENLYASGITCGPGHGISVGSLGDKNSEARVSNVTVYKAHLVGTTNGARIKSWQGGKGYAKDITFEDIIMDKVKNPIIIDQNYCYMDDPLKPKACKKQTSAVELSNIQFKNIRGTTTTKEAIKLDCSETIPCHDLVLQDVKLTFSGHDKGSVTSTCNNAKLKKLDNVVPKTC
jgi:galacturan 1,4-alpha-galacturonidase